MGTAWVLVSDTAHARIFATASGGVRWRLVRAVEHARLRAPRDHAGRSLRRTRDGTYRKTAFAPHTDPKEVAEEQFARFVAAELEAALTRHDCSNLILVAPPHFLGRLRAMLSRHAEKAVAATLAKDLVHCEDRELPSLLGDLLSLPLAKVAPWQ
jgi:protein required for attachment to host cells